jgi:hypothetical protein
MSATMKCPKCETVTKGELAGKVGFSRPGGPLATPSPKRHRFKCNNPNCGYIWYPDASEVDSK